MTVKDWLIVASGMLSFVPVLAVNVRQSLSVRLGLLGVFLILVSPLIWSVYAMLWRDVQDRHRAAREELRRRRTRGL